MIWPWDWSAELAVLNAKLDKITAQLNLISKQEKQMAVDLNAITAEVANNTNVTESVVTLLGNLTSIIQNIPPSNDPVTQAALDQLNQTLTANDAAIAGAVVANTPASTKR